MAQELKTPGIYLLAELTSDALLIHRATVIERVSRFGLHRPLITDDLTRDAKAPASELVLTVLDTDANAIEKFGWPADEEVFVHEVDEEGNLRGTPVVRRGAGWIGRLKVPIDERARYLQFARTDLRVDGDERSFRHLPLGVFDLRPSQGGDGPPFPIPQPRPPLPLPPSPPRLWPLARRREERLEASLRREALIPHWIDGGYILDARTLIQKGDPATSFDIVILGDGFQLQELGVFWTCANALAHGILAVEPFSKFAHRINVHVVQAVSHESGISQCPQQGVNRQTFFKTSGHWEGRPSPSFIGTPVPQKIFDAIDTVIPQADADLVFMIVNCRVMGGGSAPDRLKIAFVTLGLDESPEALSIVVNVAAHEAAHVLAGLREEYNPCTQRRPDVIYLNEATQHEVDSGVVPWRGFALPGELDQFGHFTAVHVYNDPVDHRCQPTDPGLASKLGVFWGGQSGDPPATPQNPYQINRCDARGAGFYRPMAECKMRRLAENFCRVCEHYIEEAIVAALP